MVDFNCKKHEGYLLTDRLYRQYFLGFDILDGYLLMSKTPTCFVDARYYYGVKNQLEKNGFNPVLFTCLADIKKEIERQNLTEIYLDYESTTLKEAQEYKSFNVQLKDGSKYLKSLREIKTEKEISYIVSACSVIENALKEAVKTVKTGITEKQLKNAVTDYLKNEGELEEAFDIIVAFNANSAIPHHVTGETELKPNSVILIDAGCKVNGYCSDITRTYFFGEPSKEFISDYEAVLNANLIAEKEIKAGDDFVKADGYAREYLKSKNLSKYFTHSLGHGVGLNIHESPTVSKNGKGKVKENQVFTIEPGVYKQGKYGIRIEDTVLVKNGKIERLFTDDKTLKIIK